MDEVARQRSAPQRSRKPVVRRRPARNRWGLRFSLGFGAGYGQCSPSRPLTRESRTWSSGADPAAAGPAMPPGSSYRRTPLPCRLWADVTGAPDSAQITLLQQPGGPPGQAHVLYNARMGLAVYSGQIAPAPADKSYQLWLVPSSGAPVNAGLVAANQQNGAVVVQLTPGLLPRHLRSRWSRKEAGPSPPARRFWWARAELAVWTNHLPIIRTRMDSRASRPGIPRLVRITELTRQNVI